MENKVLLVCSVVGCLGFVSFSLGMVAEITKTKVLQVAYDSPVLCSYHRSPSLVLALIAAVSLMIAQVIINFTSGCICCTTGRRPANSDWKLALFCYVLSWFTFVIAFFMLLTGAALNGEHNEGSVYFGTYYCNAVRPGVYGGGAILSVVSVALGILYYLTLSSAKGGVGSGNQATATPPSGIAMGHPQFPPQQISQEPVFVHEDAYVRRQLA